MRKVVFDTNVYISAVAFGGKPVDLFRRCWGTLRQIELYASHEILKETVRVLASDKFQFTREEISDLVATIVYAAEVIEPKIKIRDIADEPDNRVLECALDARADFIVSGDKHLLSLGEYKNIPIVGSARLLDLLEKRSSP